MLVEQRPSHTQDRSNAGASRYVKRFINGVLMDNINDRWREIILAAQFRSGKA